MSDNNALRPADAPEEALRYLTGPYHKKRPLAAYWAVKTDNGDLEYFAWEEEEAEQPKPTISTGKKPPTKPASKPKPKINNSGIKPLPDKNNPVVTTLSFDNLTTRFDNLTTRVALLENRFSLLESNFTQQKYSNKRPSCSEEEGDVETAAEEPVEEDLDSQDPPQLITQQDPPPKKRKN